MMSWKNFSNILTSVKNAGKNWNFTVDVGIRQLDEGTGTYNIKGALETALELSRQRVHTLMILQTARYAVNTLCFWALFMILVLQFRMWGQSGFLGL